MITLGIDCSTKWTNVGITKDGTVLGETNRELDRQQSSLLPILTEELLVKNKIDFNDIGQIAVAVGPGYYTGIRTGVAYASALGEALGINIIPLSTLKLFAYRFCENEQDFLAAFSRARKNYIYAAIYRNNKDSLDEIMCPVYMMSADFAAKLIEYPNALIIGADDFSNNKEIQSLPNVKIEYKYNYGSSVALLGEISSKYAVLPSGIRGMYLRSPDIGPTQ